MAMKNGYEKIEKYNPQIIDKLISHYTEILNLIGEDPNREGLEKNSQKGS
jgi:GTP cyclohydrolase I